MGCRNSKLQISGQINNKIVTYTPEPNIIFITYSDFRTWALQKFYKISKTLHCTYSIKYMTKYDKIWKDVGASEEIGHPYYIRLFQMSGKYYDFKFHYPYH